LMLLVGIVSSGQLRTLQNLAPLKCTFEVPSMTHVEDRGSEGAILHFPNGTVTNLGVCEHWNTVKHLPLLQRKDPYSLLTSSTPSSSRGAPPQGWQVYTYFVGNNNISHFSGQWNVPEEPSAQGQLLGTFIGLQNNCGGYGKCGHGTKDKYVGILQPVLQYGESAYGGGPYWSYLSTYTGSFGTVWSPVYKTNNQGDIIFGNITRLHGNDEQWYMDTFDITSGGKQSSLVVSRPTTNIEPDAYVTLEVYDVGSCSGYPKQPLQFQNLNLEENGNPVVPKWVFAKYSSACGENMTIISPQQVNLYW